MLGQLVGYFVQLTPFNFVIRREEQNEIYG